MQQLHNIVFNVQNEVTSVQTVSEKTMYVTYKTKQEYQLPKKSSSLLHALHVTSYGRLMLFELMQKLGPYLYYVDTGLLP